MVKSSRRIREPEYHYFSKKAALTKLRRSTQAVQREGLIRFLRKNGFAEVPLEEIHDRLGKIRRSLAHYILLDRNGSKTQI